MENIDTLILTKDKIKVLAEREGKILHWQYIHFMNKDNDRENLKQFMEKFGFKIINSGHNGNFHYAKTECNIVLMQDLSLYIHKEYTKKELIELAKEKRNMIIPSYVWDDYYFLNHCQKYNLQNVDKFTKMELYLKKLGFNVIDKYFHNSFPVERRYIPTEEGVYISYDGRIYYVEQ